MGARRTMMLTGDCAALHQTIFEVLMQLIRPVVHQTIIFEIQVGIPMGRKDLGKGCTDVCFDLVPLTGDPKDPLCPI